jgi:outer membrane protein TolC
MKISNRFLLMFLLFVHLSPTLGLAVESRESVQLAALVNEALANNPELKASEARWQAFSERIRQAGAFEDPMLMFKIQNALVRDPLAFDRDVMTAKVIGISQQVPFFGKRDLAKQMAERDAEVGRWDYEERKLVLARMVKETFYQLYAVGHALEVTHHHLHAIDGIDSLATTMYGVGSVPQQDVFKAQVERSKMEDMRILLRQKHRSLEAALNALLYRSAGTAVSIPTEIELTPINFSNDELERLAAENRPRLRALAAQVEKARVSRKLGEKEFYPDFNISLEYMQREPAMEEAGYDMYGAGVTFNLPVQRERRHAMIAEAESETRMAQEELNMLHNEIRFGIADALARLEGSRKLAGLYRTVIIPQAEGALESATSAYRFGRADFMNVLDSEMKLFEYRRDYHQMVADHQMALAELEGVVGVELHLHNPDDEDATTTH